MCAQHGRGHCECRRRHLGVHQNHRHGVEWIWFRCPLGNCTALSIQERGLGRLVLARFYRYVGEEHRARPALFQRLTTLAELGRRWAMSGDVSAQLVALREWLAQVGADAMVMGPLPASAAATRQAQVMASAPVAPQRRLLVR